MFWKAWRKKRALCRTIRRQLEAYANGKLSESETEKVKKHLEGCPRCTEIYEWEQWIRKHTLGELPSVWIDPLDPFSHHPFF